MRTAILIAACCVATLSVHADEVRPPRISVDGDAVVGPDHRSYVWGWAFGDTPVRVQVLLDGKVIDEQEPYNPRGDVQAAFPEAPLLTGFEFIINPLELPVSEGRLEVSVEDQLGNRVVTEGPEIDSALLLGVSAAASTVTAGSTFEAWVEAGIRPGTLNLERADGSLIAEALPALNEVLLGDFADQHGLWVDDVLRGTLGGVATFEVPDGAAEAPTLSRIAAAGRSFPGPTVLPLMEASPSECSGEKLRLYYPTNVELLRLGVPRMDAANRIATGSPCIDIGIRARVEFLRTTLGAERDFVFDPDFAEEHRTLEDGRKMTGGSLSEALNFARDRSVSALITLDGGVWADSAFSAPQWDVVDHLEQDDRLVQWNQHNLAEEDDALKNLPGSIASPQLARMMSLNIYNNEFRFYKKRNLQAAVEQIIRFQSENPEVDIQINFEPDNKLNPWFYWTQWYDYNPSTIRQFQEWLSRTGTYGAGGDLEGLGDASALTLAQINELAEANWQSFSEIDPPRDRPTADSAWHQTWTRFKRHLVSQHYEDLASWAVEAGATPDMLYTAVPIEGSTAITDDATGVAWSDVAGVSLEGGRPSDARLGVILYGRNTRDEVPASDGGSLLDSIRGDGDPWGIVEMSPSDIAFPHLMISLEQSYDSLLKLLNHGAVYLSPMTRADGRWRTINPRRYSSYDAFIYTPFESALLGWLHEWKDLPAGSVLFPFGLPGHASNDGWLLADGSSPHAEAGALSVSPGSILQSPEWLKVAASRVVIEGEWSSEPEIFATFEDGSRVAHRGSVLNIQGDRTRITSLRISWAGSTEFSTIQAVRIYAR